VIVERIVVGGEGHLHASAVGFTQCHYDSSIRQHIGRHVDLLCRLADQGDVDALKVFARRVVNFCGGAYRAGVSTAPDFC
jgi:hypothetical protein